MKLSIREISARLHEWLSTDIKVEAVVQEIGKYAKALSGDSESNRRAIRYAIAGAAIYTLNRCGQLGLFLSLDAAIQWGNKQRKSTPYYCLSATLYTLAEVLASEALVEQMGRMPSDDYMASMQMYYQRVFNSLASLASIHKLNFDKIIWKEYRRLAKKAARSKTI